MVACSAGQSANVHVIGQQRAVRHMQYGIRKSARGETVPSGCAGSSANLVAKCNVAAA